MSWFYDSLTNEDVVKMINSLLQGNVLVFERYFSLLAMRVFSYHDTAKSVLEKEIEEMRSLEEKDLEKLENFYHGVVLGLLVYVNDSYYIESNKESGLGRCDVAIIPKAPDKKGIILEFKRADTNETIEAAAKRALSQINAKHYDEGMKNKGIKDIVKLGIGFKGKIVKVVTDY